MTNKTNFKISFEHIIILSLIVSNLLYFNLSKVYKNLYQEQISISKTNETPTSIDHNAQLINPEHNNPNYFDKSRASAKSKLLYERAVQFGQMSEINQKIEKVFITISPLPQNIPAQLAECSNSPNGLFIRVIVDPKTIQNPDDQQAELDMMKALAPCMALKQSTFI